MVKLVSRLHKPTVDHTCHLLRGSLTGHRLLLVAELLQAEDEAVQEQVLSSLRDAESAPRPLDHALARLLYAETHLSCHRRNPSHRITIHVDSHVHDTDIGCDGFTRRCWATHRSEI